MSEVTITVRRNGSLKIEGPVRIIDSAGNDLALPDSPVISLCRCGQSQNKPFCDGSHKACNFQGAEPHILALERLAAAGPDA